MTPTTLLAPTDPIIIKTTPRLPKPLKSVMRQTQDRTASLVIQEYQQFKASEHTKLRAYLGTLDSEAIVNLLSTPSLDKFARHLLIDHLSAIIWTNHSPDIYTALAHYLEDKAQIQHFHLDEPIFRILTVLSRFQKLAEICKIDGVATCKRFIEKNKSGDATSELSKNLQAHLDHVCLLPTVG